MPSNNWHERLSLIPALQKAGMRQWLRIQAGTSNHHFKVYTDAGVWLVRLNRATLGIDRLAEQKILQQVAELGIGPTVIENDPEAGYLITEYIEKPAWSQAELHSAEYLAWLKKTLNQVHELPHEHLPSRLDQRIPRYLEHLNNTPKKTAQRLLNDIKKLDDLGFWQNNNCLYHSDLNPGNILGHPPDTTLIDWEYAGQGHPLLDWLILEHEAGIDLSAHYPANCDPEWIEPTRRLITGMMDLWPQQSP